MPLPFALDHINLWLLEDAVVGHSAGYAAVDSGIALAEVQDAWRRLLTQRRLTRCFVTHYHPDHLGLAAWLERETGAPLWMSQADYLTAQMVAEQVAPYGVEDMLNFFKRNGMEAAGIEALRRRGNSYKKIVPQIPASFRRLMDGQVVRVGAYDWRMIAGYGHAPEHICLYCDELRVLISGDMLLPRITTNIGVFGAYRRDNVLKWFLDSIAALCELPADTLVLPSHGLPFRGLHARVAQLHAHHAERCDVLLANCCAAPRTAAELIPALFDRPVSDPHQSMFAMGEAIAHLNFLEHAGALRRIEEECCTRYLTCQPEDFL